MEECSSGGSSLLYTAWCSSTTSRTRSTHSRLVRAVKVVMVMVMMVMVTMMVMGSPGRLLIHLVMSTQVGGEQAHTEGVHLAR